MISKSNEWVLIPLPSGSSGPAKEEYNFTNIMNNYSLTGVSYVT